MTAEDDVITRWKKSIEFYEALRYGAAVDGGIAFSTKSLVQLTEDFEGELGGTQFRGVDDDFYAVRFAVATALKTAATTFARHVFDYKSVLGFAGDTFNDLWTQLFRYYAENNKRVLSRGFVFGTPTADGDNVGDGAVNRCNVDAWGFTLEKQTPDAKEFRCEFDASSGTLVHEEEFSIHSTTAEGVDALVEAGSGKVSASNLKAISARNSTFFGLQNPSFSTSTPAGPTAAPTDLGGWSSNVTIDGTNYEVVSDYYRGFFGDTAPMALRCKATDFILSQTLTSAKFDLGTAYYRHVAVRRKNSADGTLTLRLGRHEKTVDLTTLTNNQWTLLKVTSETGAWHKNFGEADLTLEIERADGTVGEVDVDDVCIGEFQGFDGGLYAIVGGPATFQVDDVFTFTDAAYSTAINQTWFWRVLGLYFPSCPTAPAQPTAALAGAGAGNVDNGTHRYWTSYTDVNGIESGLSPAIAADVTVADKTTDGKVTVTRGALPGTTTHLASWNVYRSSTPASNTAKLVQSGIALGTASITDNLADANLGATHGGQSITFADPP